MASRAIALLRRWAETRAAADLLVIAGLFAWWLTARALPEDIFPSPWNVLITLVHYPADPNFLFNAFMSAVRVWLAVALSAAIGTAIALLPRYVAWTSTLVNEIVITFLNSFPGIAWSILGSIWFGLTFQATLVVQILIILPFTLVNVAEGIRTIGTEELEMARSFGRRPWAILWRIELPMLSPFILAGARIAYGVCWKVSLVAELFGARNGLGYMMQDAMDLGRVDDIIAICFSIVIFVALGEWLVWGPLLRRSGNAAATQGRFAPSRSTVVSKRSAA
ncbi:MAG TPA: ABC transporter permease subunit [Beijerinckiaceae bacterium]|nr:ABC transporter permease subunit [Beijerinckiaceae bacterium]